MEIPQVRPGSVQNTDATNRVVAFFSNSASGNSTIQLLIALGIRSDRLGVVTPERIPGGQGMILTIPCPTPQILAKVEDLCRDQGAEIQRQKR